MWYCPICQRQNNGLLCSCGYDLSADLARFPTLTVPSSISSRTAFLQKWKIEDIDTLYSLIASLQTTQNQILATQERMQKELDELKANFAAYQPVADIDEPSLEKQNMYDSQTLVSYNERPIQQPLPIRNDRFHSIALCSYNGTAVGVKYDGTLCCTATETELKKYTDVLSVAAGYYHFVALSKDGQVYSYGFNSNNQCEVSRWQDIVEIAAGSVHTVGLKTDGTVVAIGSNENGQCNVSRWKEIIHIVAGGDYTIGFKADGSIVAVGIDLKGTNTWRDIVDISVGVNQIIGLKADGTIVVTGEKNNDTNTLNRWKNITYVAASNDHLVGLKSDGTVVAVGSNRYRECEVFGWRDIVDIAVGRQCTIGLKQDGSVVYTGIWSSEGNYVQAWRDIKAPI